jgi:ankyrin repeat protein
MNPHPSAESAENGTHDFVSRVDKSGCSSLHIAAIYGNHHCARALLAAGARLDAEDDEGQTPLLSAVSFGHSDVVELLLAEGADPAKRDKMGRTGECSSHRGVNMNHNDICRVQDCIALHQTGTI